MKCPKCKNSLSDTYIRCPFCNYFFIDEVVNEQVFPEKQCQAHRNTSKTRSLKFLRFNWLFEFIDDITNNLLYIPLVGTVLSVVFQLICALVIIAIVFGAVCAIIIGLFYVSPILEVEVILVGGTIWMYFSTYRKGKQKHYFWIALALTILFPFIFVF